MSEEVKVRPFEKDYIRIKISGEIKNLPKFVRYVQVNGEMKPLISFDLISHRKRKSVEEEWKIDEHKIVLFNDEKFLKEAKEGERYLFDGEVQSRNYNRVHEDIEDLWIVAVQNYYLATKKYPCEEQPDKRRKQPVDWRELLKLGLIPEAPSDSMYDENMVKQITSETPFVYLVDVNGEVTKETQHVTYEVLVKSYKKLEEDMDSLKGDYNRVELCGRITKNPSFTILGGVPFVNFNVGCRSYLFDNYMFYPHAIAWGKNAEKVVKNFQKGDYIYLTGRLQSREYVKKFRKRWVTLSGNRRKKDIELKLKTREVSISYLEKCVKKQEQK